MTVMFSLSAALMVAFLLTGILRRYALRTDLMDIPNDRSSHEVPTPRGGGVAIVVVSLVGLVGLGLSAAMPITALLALGLGGAVVAGIGWLDDHRDVPARWRLLVHLVAAAWVVVLARGAPPLALPGVSWEWGWFGAVVLVLFIGWMLNLYNFMDGIDGIAGVEAITVAGPAAAMLWWLGALEWASVAALMASATLGFLAWNWPPAKIFMGDAGSGFIGFMLAALAVLTWADAGLSIWAWLILLGVFIVDATITLVRRAVRGEKFYEAHRSHAYQHASRYYNRHLPVTIAIGVINLLWLTPLAFTAAYLPEWGIVLLLLAWTPLLLGCLRYRAGLPD
ncbi:MraY family glycosyltransferase [Spiribacter vilamensis]|uniref:Fuc2NAc and GlcNAc transferase n=1 Tax=Spiribacter vilamensis TaxID=531306 RepID=A0A4Q8D2M5_9GAMM|nr:glycosyltransferase family 4 protein [Spiribacter vilamensis]RZU99613.1 Fuc2NAc and GlcNAc transferase [Spiribacter vilamensis]TVO61426.1 glycosyltransferase family 4 protein [Spiribacter vilamensis]